MRGTIENIGTDTDYVLEVHTKNYTYSHVELSVETSDGIVAVDDLDKTLLRQLIYKTNCNVKSTITFDSKKRDWVEVPVLKDGKIIIQLKNV
jgi:hypothetical protein